MGDINFMVLVQLNWEKLFKIQPAATSVIPIELNQCRHQW